MVENAFFAFMKFIMCLLVSEVKAVSCELLKRYQVLDSTIESRFLQASRRPWEGGAVTRRRGRFERKIGMPAASPFSSVVRR